MLNAQLTDVYAILTGGDEDGMLDVCKTDGEVFALISNVLLRRMNALNQVAEITSSLWGQLVVANDIIEMLKNGEESESLTSDVLQGRSATIVQTLHTAESVLDRYEDLISDATYSSHEFSEDDLIDE